VFVTQALRKLIADENFVTLMRSEAIDTLPKNIALRLEAQPGG
jgi:ParB family chromosome partitioning protein